MCAPYHFKEEFVNSGMTKPERNEDRRNPDQGSGITRIRAIDRNSFCDGSDESIRYFESECKPNEESEVNHDCN